MRYVAGRESVEGTLLLVRASDMKTNLLLFQVCLETVLAISGSRWLPATRRDALGTSEHT